MIWQKIQDILADQPLFISQPSDLNEILAQSEIILEQDTHIRDFIRILGFGQRIFVQEVSDRNEVLIREFAGQAAASDFVRERLNTYDRMWDGCGCKIDYYNVG